MATRFAPPKNYEIDDLELDAKNPRIPLEKQKLSQDKLAIFVAETYNAIVIARSIAAHEYFPSEPLIAIASSQSRKMIVVEGNRRLSALKLMQSPELRSLLSEEQAEWNSLGTQKTPKQVPVIVAKSRHDVAPIIGYRHISGIQQWDAYAKARYIASQLEEGLSLEQAAKDVGETQGEVRANVRNFQISEQARPLVSDETFADLIDRFGVFTRAMQSSDVRDFVGAQAPNQVKLAKKPIPTAKKPALKELVGYLFGPAAIVTDSRDLTKLGRTLASDDGLRALRAGQGLEEAHIASGGLRDRLIGRLSNAARSLRAAESEVSTYRKDKEVTGLIEECEEALEDVKRAVRKG